jgi:hypothetical protein
MERRFRSQFMQFCAVVTAVLAVGMLGSVQHSDSARPERVEADTCPPQGPHCDDTSWGG